MDNLGYGNGNAANPSGQHGCVTVSSANLSGPEHYPDRSGHGHHQLGSQPCRARRGFNTGAVVEYKAITSSGVETA